MHESNGAVAGMVPKLHLTSCGTLVILITSTGELLLYFTVILFSFIKKNSCRTVFGVVLCCLNFYCRIEC